MTVTFYLVAIHWAIARPKKMGYFVGMAIFEFDKKSTRQIRGLLEVISRKSIPFASKETLNQLAFESMRQGRKAADKKMVLRNKWTQGSVRAKPTRSAHIRSQVAEMGSTEGYMRVQEYGGRKASRGRHGTSIPTSYAAGQEGAKPRTKLVRRANRMVNIQIKKFMSRGKTRKQRMVLAAQHAVNTNNRYIFLELGTNQSVTRKGIFKVTGGKKHVKWGWPGRAKLKMVQDLTHKSVRIPKHPWMVPAALKASKMSPQFYRRALIFQLKRQRTFRA